MSGRHPAKPASKRGPVGQNKPVPATPADSIADPNGAVDSRRQKKRELDRRCQRMARERTKARITYLEDLVEEFRKQDASGRVASLMKQLEETVKERDELAKTLKLIENSIRGHRLLASDAQTVKYEPAGESGLSVLPSVSAGADEAREASVAVGQVPMAPATALLNSDISLTASEEEPALDITPSVLPDPPPAAPLEEEVEEIEPYSADDPYTPFVGQDQDVIYPPPKAPCDCCRAKAAPTCGGPLNLWRFANETLATKETYPDEILQIEDTYGDDIPIRAMLEGWDAVEARLGGTLPPMWQKLSQIDQVLFRTCPNTERLAIMRVMHLLLRYHAQPNAARKKALPPWYLKRPSQALAHSYAIDFFAWPGIRERFVFSQHRYCSNLFWHLFCRSLHIRWPFEFRDTYTFNTMTKEYQISPSFEERLRDINAWTMSRDIFKRWPEFYSDFPSCDHVPMSLTPGGVTGEQSQQAPQGSTTALVPLRKASKDLTRSPPTLGTLFRGQELQSQQYHQQQQGGQSAPFCQDEAADGYAEAANNQQQQHHHQHQHQHVPLSTPLSTPLSASFVQHTTTALNIHPAQGWWGNAVQVVPEYQQNHYGMPVKATSYMMPSTPAPHDALAALNQMYNLPI